MNDILNEAYAIVQCKECPWYKSCATPMRVSAEDIRNQLASAPGIGPSGDQSLLSNMAAAAQNSLLEGCPVFIDRLRNSQKLKNNN
jgi:hypothetical protein